MRAGRVLLMSDLCGQPDASADRISAVMARHVVSEPRQRSSIALLWSPRELDWMEWRCLKASHRTNVDRVPRLGAA